jgi:hypothetical protein
MRLARLALASAIVLGLGIGPGACGGSRPGGGEPKKPRTAAERARAEREPDGDKLSDKGKKWGGWRYQGSRDDCFFLVKRRCFTKRADACAAARCGKKQCVVEGGGPATVSCE